MTDTERQKFREAFAEKSIAELQEAHNVRGGFISNIRAEQLVLHELQTEKEHVRERSLSAGHSQVIGAGAIDDDKILSAFKSDPSLLERIKAKILGSN